MSTPQEIRARILDLQRDRKPERLEYEGWGPDLYIRILSAGEQAELAESTTAQRMPVRVILHCLVTADGERVFTDEDEDALLAFPFPEVMQAFGQVAKLNGISSKELEEAVEHFRTAPDEQRSSE